MERLLEEALLWGIPLKDFWDYTVKEVQLIMEQAQKRQEYELELQKQSNYSLAIMIASFTNSGLVGKSPPKYSELYPSKEAIQLKKEKEDMITKERLLAFAQAHNQQRRE